MQPRGGQVVRCVALQTPQGCEPNAWVGALVGADGRLPSRSVQRGLGTGLLLGTQISASRGGAGAEAATNPVSARTPHQPPITVRPTFCPPRPLFPLAGWPPRVCGLLTSARADQAMCRIAGPARGPPGLAVRQSARALAQSHLPGVAPEGRDKAFWEAGFSLRGRGWGGRVAAARRSTGLGPRSSSGSTFPSSPSAALPMLRGFPHTQLSYPPACELLAEFGVHPVTFLEVAGAFRRSPFVRESRVSLTVTHSVTLT